MGNVVVFGSANMDLVASTARIPALGETVLGHEFLTTFGGKGANEAVAAARLGGRVTLVASVGDDNHGRQYLNHLGNEGIDTTFVRTDLTLPTGCALITVQTGGDNTIVVCPGANSAVTVEHIRAATVAVSSADVVLVQYEIPTPSVLEVIRVANAAGVPVIVNISPVPSEVSFGSSRVDYLIVNQHEAASICKSSCTGEDGLKEAATILHGLNVETVIITCGPKPTFVSSNGLQFMVSTTPVEAIDTVGAGDTFAGALATALSESFPLRMAVEFANQAAALATTKTGAQTSMPVRDQITVNT